MTDAKIMTSLENRSHPLHKIGKLNSILEKTILCLSFIEVTEYTRLPANIRMHVFDNTYYTVL